MAQAESVVERDLPENPLRLWRRHGITESKFFREYVKRLTAGRDMHAYVTAASETGVGKTTLAMAIAMLWDQHGWTADKATLTPEEFNRMYDQVPPGSVLLLDEAEQATDRRRSTSTENVEVSHDFATKRYKQVFGLMTAPSRSWLDTRISDDAADYWIQALETPDGEPKGEARVYRLQENEHYEKNYTERTEIIEWPVLDGHPELERLDSIKHGTVDGDGAGAYVRRDELEEATERARKEGRKEKRNELIQAMDEAGLIQKDIGDICDIHRSTVSRVINGEVDG
jgi:hypothetical protein